MDNDIYYIWLSNACGVGNILNNELLSIYKNAENIYNLSEKELLGLKDKHTDMTVTIKDEHIKRLANKNLDRENRIMEYCMSNNVTVMTYENKLYPAGLKNIRIPPVVLYCKGKIIDIDNELCIAMVGTRKMSNYGKFTAYKLAANLADGGAVVVSGLARGIDSASHKGCLFAKGFTIAVLGSGIDVVYPRENKVLMDIIIERGMVLTEYAPFTEPKGSNFPVRNRIISGISRAVVVVEADKKSGALITARTGLFQGKDIFAVPGNIDSKSSEGTNELIKNGALIVTCAEDILNEYAYSFGNKRKESKAEIKTNNNYTDYTENKAQSTNTNTNTFTGKKFFSNQMPQHTTVPDNDENNSNERNDSNDDTVKEKNTLTPEMKLLSLDISLDDTEIEIFRKINDAPEGKIYPDTLVNEKFNISEIMNLLSTLEIYGIIVSGPGGSYVFSNMYLNMQT